MLNIRFGLNISMFTAKEIVTTGIMAENYRDLALVTLLRRIQLQPNISFIVLKDL
jgi:hypothetical protein